MLFLLTLIKKLDLTQLYDRNDKKGGNLLKNNQKVKQIAGENDFLHEKGLLKMRKIRQKNA